MSEKNIIKVCLGSSCFARGNEQNLEIIEAYVKKYKLETKIEICGLRCEDICEKGPNITIDGTSYNNITSETLETLLEKLKG